MIVVAGGTGRLGNLVVRALLADGQRVRVLSRGRVPDPGLSDIGTEMVRCDVRDAAAVMAAVDGARVVVSAVQGLAGKGRVSPASVDRDGNEHLIAAAAAARADVVLLSVVGADAEHPAELFRMKAAAERRLMGSGLSWTVVRATAYAELHLELLRRTAGRTGRPMVLGRGQNPVNFVAVGDVAEVVHRAVVDPTTRGRILEVGGPQDLTMNELAAVAQRQLGTEGRALRHLPRGVLRAVASTGRIVPSQPARLAALSLLMDLHDMTFAPAEPATVSSRRTSITTLS